MKAEECPELDTFYKIKMILDKDCLDEQYAEAIRFDCARCDLPKMSKGGEAIEEDEGKIQPKNKGG